VKIFAAGRRLLPNAFARGRGRSQLLLAKGAKITDDY
jgi:hypothetical protein